MNGDSPTDASSTAQTTTDTDTDTETHMQINDNDTDDSINVPTATLDPITNRSEIVYLFDATDANPNGDPLTEENRPRIDEATNRALVSDVRMKRTVRDYLERNGYEIFVRKSGAVSGKRDDKNDRFAGIKQYMVAWLIETGDHSGEVEDDEQNRVLTAVLDGSATDDEEIDGDDVEKALDTVLAEVEDEDAKEGAFLAAATDVRLFGDAMAFDKAKDAPYLSGAYTGPLQFGWTRSMNEVRIAHDGKTSVLSASSEDQMSAGGNMYTSHRIPYALFCAHGVLNEHSAQQTRLSAEDVELAMDGLWSGVHDMNTASKVGHQPRLLLRVGYAEGEPHVGDLHRDLELVPRDTDLVETEYRDISDVYIDATHLLDTLERHAERIETVTIRINRRTEVLLDADTVADPDVFVKAISSRVGDANVVAHTE